MHPSGFGVLCALACVGGWEGVSVLVTQGMQNGSFQTVHP